MDIKTRIKALDDCYTESHGHICAMVCADAVRHRMAESLIPLMVRIEGV